MSATGDVARMLTLVPWLLERPGASVAETAAAFGVAETTIRRDLGLLDFCGLPGLGGGDLFDVSLTGDRIVVQMADELRRPLRPTASEALRLVLTVDAVADLLGDEVPALRTAVAKVRDALGVPEGVADVVGPHGDELVATARRAVTDGRRLRLHYQGRADHQPQAREMDPWGLHVVDGLWYLQGFDHGAGAMRTFRMDRVADLVVTETAVVTSPPADLPPPRYVPGPEDTEVVLDLGPQARWLVDAIDDAAVEERPDGSTRVRFRTDAVPWVVRLVLMGGGAVAVVEPDRLREDVVQAARATLGAYGDHPASDGVR